MTNNKRSRKLADGNQPRKRRPGLKTAVTRMTTKGQITIGIGIRETLGLKPGDQVIMSVVNPDTVTLRRMKSFQEVIDSLPLATLDTPLDWKTLREEIAEEMAEKVFRQIREAGWRRENREIY